MDDPPKTIRDRVIECVVLLASAKGQKEYERDVPIAYVPAELKSSFCDDLFHPKSPDFTGSFSEVELKDLAVLYGLLHRASKSFRDCPSLSVGQMLKLSQWREVMFFSKGLADRLKNTA